MQTVSLSDADNYTLDVISGAILKNITDLKFPIPCGKKILLKPNILAQNRPDQHSITHYIFIEALCKILLEHNNKITIGESIAFYQKGLTKKAFITSKLEDIVRKYNITLVAFDEEKPVRIKEKITSNIPLYLPQIIFSQDLIINLPKLKTHSGLRLSGAVKNLFGCIPGGYKQKIHIYSRNDFELSDVFLDLVQIIKPAINIMDAVYGLDGGPSAAGKPVFTGKIIAAYNPVALDIVASGILGYKPEEISTLIRAKERKMINDFNDIKITGTIPKAVFKKLIKAPIKTVKPKDNMFVTDTFVNPVINASKCNLCQECIEFCPVNAIKKNSSNNKVPLIDYGLCINCYYCLKACRQCAFTTKASFKNKFINFMRFILNI